MNKSISFIILVVLISFIHCSGGILPEDVKIVTSEEVYLIKNGTVVNADQTFVADVLIQNGIIRKIYRSPSSADDDENKRQLPVNTKIIDASGKYIMPGGIDPHVHLELPFMGTVSKDDFETGTKAALAGGTTMIMDFAIPSKQESPVKVLKEYLEKASKKAASDYAFHVGIVHYNETIGEEMKQLVNEYGINSFKFFMAYKNAFMINEEEMYEAMIKSRQLGAISMVHCENGELVVKGQEHVLNALNITGPEGHPLSRPSDVEAEATHRAAVLAHKANAPLYVVHVMSKDAMEEVARAKARGWRVVGVNTLTLIVLGLSSPSCPYLKHNQR